MKISRREKHILWVLGAVIAGVGYYNFVFANQSAILAEKRDSLETIKSEYDTNTLLINSLSTRMNRMEETYNTLISRRSGYYSDVVQSKIILKLEDLLKASGLIADISFDELDVDNIEVLSTTAEKILKDTLEGQSDEYNGITTTESEDSSESDTTNNSDDKNITEEVVKQQKVTMKYSGTYESLKLFLNLAEANSRKIVISNLTLLTGSETEVAGEMKVEFYSLASLDKEDILDSSWTINNIYGKDKFISSGVATGSYNNASKSDFSLVLRASGSALPTVSLGQTSDTEKISSVTSNKTSIEDVTVEFNEENGKFYYKYAVGKETFPKENSQLGMTFTPNSEDIIFDILSTERIGVSDNSGVNLKIVNNTSKKVNVVVNKDDKTKPRVNTTSEGNVTVTKK